MLRPLMDTPGSSEPSANRITTVVRKSAAIVALFTAFHDAIAADRLEAAAVVTAVALDRVPVVTLLAGVHLVVAAQLQLAARIAPVAGTRVPVVTGLPRLDDVVAALRRREGASARSRWYGKWKGNAAEGFQDK